MAKRVFVGLPAGEEVVKTAELWQNQHIALPVRWLEQKNLHVTLVPPWQTENVPGVIKQLEKITSNKILLEFKTVDFGPKYGQPRLVWATGLSTKQLLDLRALVFGSLGQQPGTRPFFMHLTLARFKPGIFTEFPKQDWPQPINWQMNAEKFVLYESILRPEGADYKVLGEFGME
ncbi:MAG: RNA 2',3'-cyclic phosphodiesterase [Patescibacteria group bacterium]|nr:RNA 2',3'-cyclic phosphodiesterase [Patescibacteria group bacterium]